MRLRTKRLGVAEQRRGDLDLLGFGEINGVTLNGRSQRLVERQGPWKWRESEQVGGGDAASNRRRRAQTSLSLGGGVRLSSVLTRSMKNGFRLARRAELGPTLSCRSGHPISVRRSRQII